MSAYWDEKARENPMWFIHNVLDYSNPNEAEFWRSGDDNLLKTLAPFGLALGETDRVLEIGCGIGRMTAAISRRVASVVAVDVSEEMVAQARTNLADRANVEVVKVNGRDLHELPDASVDVAYSFIVFQHIPDPEVTYGYIREIGRVLRPGGWTLFHVSEAPEIHRAETHTGDRTLRHRIKARFGRAPVGTYAPQWLGSAVERAALLDALAAGGLHLERTIGDGTQFCFVHATRPG